MNNTDLQNRPQYQEEDSIDLKVLIIKILSYWYLFVIGVVVALAFGFFYIRYTPSTYQTSASVFIKEDKMGIDPTSMMTGLTFKSNINIDNEKPCYFLQSKYLFQENNIFSLFIHC